MIDSSSAAMRGILYERILSLGGPGVMRLYIIYETASEVSMDRKAGLLVFNQSIAISYWRAS